MKHKVFTILCIIMIMFAGTVFAQESEFRMPEGGISVQSLLYLFNFDVGEADELAFIYAGDNDFWQGRDPLPEGFRYQFYIVNFTEEHYGVFATDETSGNRTSLHFFHQGNRNMDDFYADTVPEMVMFDPDDPYVFLTGDFQIIENYYTELSNQFTSLVAQRDLAQQRFDDIRAERYEIMARLNELEETDEAYAEARQELDSINEELLHALAELDASEYEIEKLQARIRELQAEIARLQGENSALAQEVQDLHDEVAFLEELKDPYKVRMMELDREGYTPFFRTTLGFQSNDVMNQGPLPYIEGEVGTYITNERTGLIYLLVSLAADVNSDKEYGVTPQVVFSLPREMFQTGVRANFGDSGRNSYIYRDVDDGYQGVVSPFASFNVLGRDSRAGLEGGIEASVEESTHAYYLNFTYGLNTIYFPWLSFVIDEFSFAAVQGEREGSRFRASAGFDINWTAGSDEDPEWGGYKHSWFFRFNYQVDTDDVANRVDDYMGFEVGVRLFLK